MIKLRIKKERPSGMVVDIDKVIIEIIKDGKIVAIIQPTKEGIKIYSENLTSFEANNGSDVIPQTPIIFLKF